MTRDEAIDHLAARLFWNMERHDPTLEPIPEWENVAEGTQELYRVLIRDLIRYDDVIKVAQQDDGDLQTTPSTHD